MFEGETISTVGPTHVPAKCPDCGDELIPKPLGSGRLAYIGTWCHCGPYSRESDYYPSRAWAELAMKHKAWFRTGQPIWNATLAQIRFLSALDLVQHSGEDEAETLKALEADLSSLS